MERTQIYLDRNEVALLDKQSRLTGASRSELIRRAIRATYGEISVADKIAAVYETAGSWKDRDFTGAGYVDRIRGDLNDRLRKLGFD